MKKRIGLLAAVLVAGLLCYLLFERQHDTGDDKQPRGEDSPRSSEGFAAGKHPDLPVRARRIIREPVGEAVPAEDRIGPESPPPRIERQPEQEDAADTASTPAPQEPDTQPPKILSGPVVTAVTENSATIEWTTDEPADGVIEFGVGPGALKWGSESKYSHLLRGDSGRTKHSIILRGLSPGTCYHFRVKSTDPHGNGPAKSSDHGFLTFGEATNEADAERANETLSYLWGNGAGFCLTRKTIQRSRKEAEGEGVDAKVLWKRDLPNDVEANPIALGEKWVIGDDRGYVLCFESQTGKELWKKKGCDRPIALLHSFENTIVAASEEGFMVLEPQGGQLIREFKFPREEGQPYGGLSGSLASDRQVLYVKYSRKVAAVDILSGTVVWEQTFQSELGWRMLAEDGNVYVAEKEESAGEEESDTRTWTIWKLDSVTGKKVWSSSRDYDSGNSLRIGSLHRDKLYFSGGYALFRLSAATGEIEKEWDQWTAAPPAARNGWLYLGTMGYPGTCCKMLEEDETVAWGFQTKGGDNWAKPQIGDGMIAFGSDDGFLYIVRDSTGEVVLRERITRFVRSVSYCPRLRQFVASASSDKDNKVVCVQLTGGK